MPGLLPRLDPSDVPLFAVYSMGPGDDIFAHFGHSALCVTDRAAPRGRCYNWGTADFSTPVPLTYEFVRGRAKFWVSEIELAPMVRYYELEDRSVWRQVMPLTSSQAIELRRLLDAATDESAKYYRYHHFQDNCTTRIRDLVDRVLDGALQELSDASPSGPTDRDYAKEGFRGHPWLLVVANLALGRVSDRPTTLWEGMFLPIVFRDAVEKATGAKPELVYERRGPPFGGAVWAGEAVLYALGAALAALILFARGRRSVSAIAAVLLGLVGAFLWTLALASAFSELAYNEVLLVLVPFDLALPLLRDPWVVRYLRVRLSVIAVSALLRAVGIFVQPLLPSLIFAGAPLASLLWARVRRSRAGPNNL
jgi:uncharacterized protein DUF4105